ncbi:calcium-binding protein [Pseudomonas sp. TH08]|uniref:calcium-binding protein n=1 Tax=unclassified Pseudomonas TaxID=196821 RepID=UPI001913EB99|nr:MULTISPECIES: calcium-binding protein [unclassified Pseudomonas]MBK5527384.1 calcium-binding protein [Pseudomonas sp. TH06]MBK5531362.1 calcium-binding protein [Pseudomonas sp. TH08]
MAKLIQPAVELVTFRTLQISDIDSSANTHAPPAGHLQLPAVLPEPTARPDKSPAPTLKSLDKRYGPLRIGEFTVSRVELEVLGAKINGQHLSPDNLNLKVADQGFLDSMSFDPAKVVARIVATDVAASETVATLMFEISTLRSVDAPALMVSAEPVTPGSQVDRLNKLSNAAQKIDIHRVNTLDHLPSWVHTGKTYLTSGAGVGLQAYGIYSGYMGLVEAIKVGDWGEAAFNGGAIGAELGSLIIERGLTKTGEAMLESGSKVFGRFPATSVGKYMARGAGLFASVITLPFDVFSAIKSFNAAAATSGKESQDHYVAGSLSVAGAGISIALGLAALKGFGAVAGPLGIAAAVVLILTAEIYRAARVVDDIDDYIELTAHERLRSGWFAFTRQELDEDIMDRFKIAQFSVHYAKQLQGSTEQLLEGAYKNYVEHVVNGNYRVVLEPVKVWRYQWDETLGEQPYKADKLPTVISADDRIDARDGLPADLRGVITGTPGDDKAILWRLGGGDDQVVGVQARPNIFSYAEGEKVLTGGDKNDVFYFEATRQEFDRTEKPAKGSVLDAGAGNDTLTFEGSRPTSDTRHVGYDVNLQTGKIALRSQDATVAAVEVAQIKSIENLSTLRNGSNRITGSDGADQISANGNDHVAAGAGDDTIIIRGTDCRVGGGPGIDRYYIANTAARPVIIEDGTETSIIEFGWPLARIQRWQVIGTSLVVTSLKGVDGEEPDHVLTVEGVYQQIDDKRVVKNSRLLFKTQDRYELEPVLALQLTDALAHDVECRVLVIGERPPAPHIANSGTVDIFTHPATHHFVSRNGSRLNIFAPANAPEAARTLHLDYDATDILDVRVSYDVSVSSNAAGVRYLQYEQFNLWLLLPSKTLNFTGVIKAKKDRDGQTGFNNIKTTFVQVRHPIVLIMRDGTSYNIAAPRVPYREDADAPGSKTLTARECLQPRQGKYPFVRPGPIKPVQLGSKPQAIDFPPPPHNGTYVLHGQASSYDVYPVSNSTFSLSTPGAIAQTSDASSWTIFTTKMTETITRDDIRLDARHLQIGSAVIQLPSVDHAGPVESISVATSSGNIYSVELLFEVLQLYVIDARGYADVDALLADIRRQREKNELATKITVKNIGFTPRMAGTVYYDSVDNYWSIDSDPALRIEEQDLFIEASQNA